MVPRRARGRRDTLSVAGAMRPVVRATSPPGRLRHEGVGSRAAFACVAALALFGAAPAHAQFVDPLDLPAEPTALAARGLLNAVAGAGSRLVAVGQRGHVVLSDDGGVTWTQAAVPVSSDLTGVHFASPSRGWAVGHGGVVLTTDDGGRSWAKQLDGRRIGPLLAARYGAGARGPLREQIAALSAPTADWPLLDVWFDDERSGFAVGAFNLILRTDDGGASWTPWLDRAENPKSLHLHAIRRVGRDLYVAGEQGLLLRLDRAAQRFEAQRAGYGGSFFGVTGAGRTVLAFGLRGTVVRSDDGGATWRRVSVGVGSSLTGGAALPDGRLVLATQSGQLLVSADGGGSFGRVEQARALPASAVLHAGGDAVVLVGAMGARVVRLR